jgi:hypothetical protein
VATEIFTPSAVTPVASVKEKVNSDVYSIWVTFTFPVAVFEVLLTLSKYLDSSYEEKSTASVNDRTPLNVVVALALTHIFVAHHCPWMHLDDPHAHG